MIKLCRNTFAKSIITLRIGIISFDFVKKLHELQEAEALKLTNRLTCSHVNFCNKKINVRLVAHVISSSVALSVVVSRYQ